LGDLGSHKNPLHFKEVPVERIFDVNSKYGPVADQLDREIAQAVSPIIDKYVEQGYCPRDIHYVAISAVWEQILAHMIRVKP
jgi:hypothetical protein